jgi:hypothetical protein
MEVPRSLKKNDAAVIDGSERRFKDNLARAARDRCPTHGYEPTREDAMAAFAKSWRRE